MLNLAGNIFLRLLDEPGPLCIMRGTLNRTNLELAAGICLRYSKARGRSKVKAAWGASLSAMENRVDAPLLQDDMIRGLLQDAQAIKGDEG